MAWEKGKAEAVRFKGVTFIHLFLVAIKSLPTMPDVPVVQCDSPVMYLVYFATWFSQVPFDRMRVSPWDKVILAPRPRESGWPPAICHGICGGNVMLKVTQKALKIAQQTLADVYGLLDWVRTHCQAPIVAPAIIENSTREWVSRVMSTGIEAPPKAHAAPGTQKAAPRSIMKLCNLLFA